MFVVEDLSALLIQTITQDILEPRLRNYWDLVLYPPNYVGPIILEVL